MSEREWERVGESGREWESERVRVRKPLRTAKEPALVFCFSSEQIFFKTPCTVYYTKVLKIQSRPRGVKMGVV